MSTPEFPTDPNPYPEASQATTVLVLGILGLPFFCGVLAPFAWVMGNRELAAIDSGLRPPENRGTANAGRILGIVGTVFLAIGVLFVLFFLVVGIFSFSVGDFR